jgi:hypothetical protein
VGSRLVQTVAKKNADDFFSAFARQLGGTGQKQAALSAPADVAAVVTSGAPAAPGCCSPLGSPVPAWLVLFTTGLGFALGYCVALLR